MKYFVLFATVFGLGCLDNPNQGETSTKDVGADIVPDSSDVAQSGDQSFFRTSEPGPIPEYEQRVGDPVLGRDILINDGYISCGIPEKIFDRLNGTGALPILPTLSDRTGDNEGLSYIYTKFERDGVKLVSTNCLACHANVVNGEVVVGLGNDGDYTSLGVFEFAEPLRGLLDDEKEIAEFDRWFKRVSATIPHIKTDTIGVNSADNLPGVLIAHRDPETWEWRDEPFFPEPDPVAVPLSVPPLWNVDKKNGLYYTGMGREDHSRFMMAAALLCTDSIEEAREIDEKFVHVRAYLETLEPPAYPFPVDSQQAERGEEVYEQTCAQCHGTYGPDGSYPNLVIGLDEIGTDPVLAGTASLSSHPVNSWFNGGFFGEEVLIAPAEGYMAPPLDGVWATAPYLHNASIPTLALLLDSSKRPLYWSINYATRSYDSDAVGLDWITKSYGKDGTEDEREKREIYDTTRPGYDNGGHTYGDALSDAQRDDLIEYLKTL